jgi:death on curing protein
MVYQYEPDSSIYRLAAVLAYAICKNHAYVDGNKRLSAMASISFLDINGYTVEATEDELFAIFMSLASGEVAELDLVSWFEYRGRRLF